jgi:hypothetical protein
VILLPLAALLGCSVPSSGGTAVIAVFQGSTPLASGGSFNFGNQQQGIPSTPVTFTIKNTGTASVDLSSSGALSVTGSNAADFSVSTQPALTIAAGASTTFALVFTPSLLSAENAGISVSSALGSYTFTLAGTGTSGGTLQLSYIDVNGSPQAVAAGVPVQFPGVFSSSPNTVSVTFTIKNTSATQPLALVGSTPLSLTNTSPGGSFSITSNPTSPVPKNNGTTTFIIQEVYIGPTGTTKTGTVTLKTSDGSNQTFTFSVSGYQS